uniref:CARD domain-containing protein n=1 Tax=Gouania willdenowi TaxID=441366 RepID=A0A8C5GKU7_GOUWI
MVVVASCCEVLVCTRNSATNLKQMGEEELWDLINDNRHRISLDVQPGICIPYLRQARVLTEIDQDEILTCHNLVNRCMRTSHMLDLLRTQGRNGAVALLESLMIHYPRLYTKVTGHKPSTEPSRFSGWCFPSLFIEFSCQLQSQSHLSELNYNSIVTRTISQLMEHKENSTCLQAENQRLQRAMSTSQREIIQLKEEKCDLYRRYTAAIEERSAVNDRLHELNLQVQQTPSTFALRFYAIVHNLHIRLSSPVTSDVFGYRARVCGCQLINKSPSLFCFKAYVSRDEAQVLIARILVEKDELRSRVLQLQDNVLHGHKGQIKDKQSSKVTTHTHTHTHTSTSCSNLYCLCLRTVRSSGKGRDFPVYLCIYSECHVPLFASSVSKSSAPPFLVRSRPKAIRVNGRVLSISFQGEALFSQLTVVGGNKTGVFVHRVKEGSAAHTVGISPGAQIVEVSFTIKMVLEDSTLEEATWALSQVSGLCHLSLRPKQDGTYPLLQQLQSGQLSSGDSFYVRVNMSLAAGPNETLSVSCNDILHVTNTRPAGAEDSWHACQVHPNELHDLKSGNVPNYYRWEPTSIKLTDSLTVLNHRCFSQDAEDLEKKKMVRIVGTGRQGRNPLWVSVEEEPPKSTESGDTCAPKSCMTLMPYTLVTPHFPPTCRPILLLPTVLGRVLGKKVSRWQGFELCEPGKINTCLDCVRRLHRFNIFPIIIFISQNARSTRKLKSKLQRHSQLEEQVLACSRSEEPLLDKLPCLYHRVSPDSWCDQTSLLTNLRTVICVEQRKIVWVEPELW